MHHNDQMHGKKIYFNCIHFDSKEWLSWKSTWIMLNKILTLIWDLRSKPYTKIVQSKIIHQLVLESVHFWWLLSKILPKCWTLMTYGYAFIWKCEDRLSGSLKRPKNKIIIIDFIRFPWWWFIVLMCCFVRCLDCTDVWWGLL